MSIWSYEGKKAVVVGCFSGMGEATARELATLGAEVHGFDIREPSVPLASFRKIDLKDTASIDAAVASIEGEVDTVFNCAGLPNTFPLLDIMKVNFIGMRYWTEQVLPKVRSGGAIATIASTAGMGYMRHIAEISELLATRTVDEAIAWTESHQELIANPDAYSFSKEALSLWTMQMGVQTIAKGVRINCICPGPTETPMMNDFESFSGGAKVIDVFAQPINRRSKAVEQAYPLIFLNSDAASYINGHVLNVDGGFVGGVMTGQIDIASSVEKVMRG